MKNKRSQIIWRYGVVSFFISVMALAIVWCAVNTTVVKADEWNKKADSLLSRVYFEHPTRGDILADDGTVLATNISAYTIYIDYRTNARFDSTFVANLGALSDSMAYYYPKRTAAEWKQYLAEPLAKPRTSRMTNRLLLKDVPYADYKRILGFPFFKEFKEGKKYSHGLYYTSRERRVRPYGQMAQRSIGRCNYVPVPKFEGASRRQDTTDMLTGFSGLEYSLNDILFGRMGTSKMVQLTRGVRTWEDVPAVKGSTVHTTIDIHMQDIVENELTDMLQKTEADWGTCIVMEVATGNIKAISNLDRDKVTGECIEAMNYALMPYEPGSVMKPISMIVAMNKGYAFPLSRTMPIGGAYAYGGGSPIRDSHSPAYLPVDRFIEYSSNIGMTKLLAPHYESNLNGFREDLKSIGLLDTLHSGMAGEYPPIVPMLDPRAGGKVSLSRMVYGYSTMIPPLYTCAIYNAIANDGRFVRPRIVQDIIHPDGTVENIPISYVRDSILSPKNAALLRGMIREVVWGQGGTAKALKDPTVEIAGKTGTARIAVPAVRDSITKAVIKPAGYMEGHYRLAFCGFFPYENPKYTCMVLISNPSPAYRGAGTTSGMVLKNIALKMYARGMLDNSSDYRAGASADDDLPVIYASSQAGHTMVKEAIGADKTRRLQQPKPTEQGTVPDLTGLSVRDAMQALSAVGLKPKVVGAGYAVQQSPAPGTKCKPGDTVRVTFTNN